MKNLRKKEKATKSTDLYEILEREGGRELGFGIFEKEENARGNVDVGEVTSSNKSREHTTFSGRRPPPTI